MPTDYDICKTLCDTLFKDAIGLWLATGGSTKTDLMVVLMPEKDFVHLIFDGTAPDTPHEREVAQRLVAGATSRPGYADALSRRNKGAPAYTYGCATQFSAHERMGLQSAALETYGDGHIPAEI